MLTLGHIRHFVDIHSDIAYIMIILGVIVEGEIVVILAGIFANIGALNIIISFIAAVIGGSLKSVIGYSAGYYLQKHHSHRPIMTKAENRINYFLPRFAERPFWSIFVSRFLILGLHWFSVLYAGYKKIRIREYIEAEFSSLVVWAIGMLSLGFFFSFTALSISRDIRKVLGIIFICFILFFILEKIVAFIIELIGPQK